MALDFPNNPGIGQTYGFGTRLWTWTGEAWNLTLKEIPAGPQGAQGVQGLSNQGTQGAQGIQNTQGTQGIQGQQGTQGLQGPLSNFQGTQGIQGIQGLQGTQGLQGLQGLQGTQGTILSPTGGIPVGETEPERVFYISQSAITTSYTVPSGFNVLSVGPHTLGTGVTVTVPEGSTWIVIEPS
jgi:hypothetical protein